MEEKNHLIQNLREEVGTIRRMYAELLDRKPPTENKGVPKN